MSNIKATYNLTSQDRTLLVMPLFHVHGLIAGLLTSLMSGGSIVIPLRFSASEFWRDFVQHGVTWYTAVPTIHQILLRNPIPEPVPSIRFVRSCSSPLSTTVHAQLEQLLKAPVLEAYAMTEAAHQMTSNPLPPASRKPGSVGRAQGTKLSIMDDNGQELPSSSIGEVCIQGPNVTKGYLGDPKATGNPFHQNGHFRTGDQGYLDKDGYLFLTGRIKELINKGGEKISPVEIDNLFGQHPKVLEAVTFAVKDDLYGQDLAVAITLREGSEMSSEELLAWFGQRAVKFKIPRQVSHNKALILPIANRQFADSFFHQYAQDSNRQGAAPDGSKSRNGKRSGNLPQYCNLRQSFGENDITDNPRSARSAKKLGQLFDNFEGVNMDDQDPNEEALEDNSKIMPTIDWLMQSM